MSSSVSPGARDSDSQQAPLGQRLYDNWLVLMIAGILIMAVIYTGWGLWEVTSLPVAELP
jgi:hypothetical protein